MRRIIKTDAPAFWVAYRRKHKKERYADLRNSEEGRTVRKQLTAHLVEQQQYLCAYCCRSIDEDHAHNEHICPQHTYPQCSMEYENILASCTTNTPIQTCGAKKGNTYDQSLFISPLEEDCETHFRFLANGVLEGVTERGKYTVDLLNLNAYALTEARKNLYLELMSYPDREYIYETYLQPHNGKLHRYVDMVSYFYEAGDFDDAFPFE